MKVYEDFLMSETTQFFLGTVKFISGNISTTTFEVGDSDAIITVRNDLHLRFNKPVFSTKPFQILFPMTALENMSGTIPTSCLNDFELQKYIQLRDDKSLRKKYGKLLLQNC